jgi:putative transposase
VGEVREYRRGDKAMGHKGNRYSADTKAEIALRACREDMTLSELSSEYGVSSAQINRWKKTLTERASELFDNSKTVDIEKVTDPLYREIGRLKMDIEWLKKKR